MGSRSFAERFEIALNGDGLSAFARKCGIPESSLRKYKEGASPSIERAHAIARTAGVNLHWLATGEGPMRPEESPPEVLSSSQKPRQTADSAEIEARLSEIEARIDAADAEERAAIYRELQAISAREDIPQKHGARADLILDFLGDPEAEPRRRRRIDRINADLGARGRVYDRAVREIGFTPPTMTGMMLKHMLVRDELSENRLRDILSAMKYDAETHE